MRLAKKAAKAIAMFAECAILAGMLVCVSPIEKAAAQWQVPNHSVPIGKGTGDGFGSVGPCATSQIIVGGGASADPTCGSALPSGFFANPSASIGLSAVNGTATTAMRSDGAPALSQSIAPTWTGRHIWGLTPAYDLASNVLGVGILMPLNSGTQTVAANKQWNSIRLSQADGNDIVFTVGASGLAEGIYSAITSGSGSDSTSNTYAGVFTATNAGPGTVKAAHIAGFGSGTSSGVLFAASFGITPVATQNVASAAIQVGLTSSGVNDVVSGIGFTSSSDRFIYGIGSAVSAIPINIAFYDAWMATASSAGANAFQVRNNAGTVIGKIDKTGIVTAPSVNLSATSNQLVFQSAGVTGTLSWAPSSTNKTITLPNGTTDFTATGGTSQVVKQTSSGGAFTVARLACADLSDSGTGCAGSSNIVVGTTVITSGTNGRVLYDNSGVVGEMTTTGSGTVLALATSPSFTTPAIGAATGASLILTGTGANALAVGRQGSTNPVLNVDASASTVVTGLNLAGTAAGSRMLVSVTSSGTDEGLSIDAKGAGTIRLGATSTGAIEHSRNAVPTTTGAVDLGTTSLMWGSLFLKSGGVINFNNGNLTLTHSAGVLTQSGQFVATTVTGGSASNGIDITTGSITRNNVGGNISIATGNNDGTSVNFTAGTGGGTANVIAASKTQYAISSWHLVASTGAASLGAPTLTSCGGGSPAITGNDFMGVVTMGTTATGCVITFASAYTGTPYCVVTWQATPLASQSYAVSNTAITLTQTSTSSNKVNYYCMATNGGWLLKRDLDPANDNTPMWLNEAA